MLFQRNSRKKTAADVRVDSFPGDHQDGLTLGENTFNNPLVSQETHEKNFQNRTAGNSLRFHIHSPEINRQTELFRKMSLPFIVPGRQDLGSFLYFGGLGATNYSWRDFAMKIADRSGVHTEAYSLEGHSGDWGDLKRTTHKDWIKSIQSIVSRQQNRPTVFCYSTSALVAFEIERRNPGTFAAIVAVGAPLFLLNRKIELYLNLVSKVETTLRALKIPRRLPISLAVDFQLADDAEMTKQKRKSPVVDQIPLSAMISLRRMQRIAQTAVRHIECPLYYAQGALDPAVLSKVPDYLNRLVPAKHKEIKVYARSAHGPQLGVERSILLRDVCNFLTDVFAGYENLEYPAPRFSREEKQTSKAHVQRAIIRNCLSSRGGD
jgi:esterase/lipase